MRQRAGGTPASSRHLDRSGPRPPLDCSLATDRADGSRIPGRSRSPLCVPIEAKWRTGPVPQSPTRRFDCLRRGQRNGCWGGDIQCIGGVPIADHADGRCAHPSCATNRRRELGRRNRDGDGLPGNVRPRRRAIAGGERGRELTASQASWASMNRDLPPMEGRIGCRRPKAPPANPVSARLPQSRQRLFGWLS
jgi:hypothetical protein